MIGAHPLRIGATGSCGPLDVHVVADDAELATIARAHLDLFAGAWRTASRRVEIDMVRKYTHLNVRGDFLNCAHMRVDRYPSTYAALTEHQIGAQGMCSLQQDRWTFCVPPYLRFDEPQRSEIEDLFLLACTIGWRAEGWLPLHAAAVAKGNVCAIVCAPSGGGKSTLTAALMRSGWQALGDDKLLLRADGEQPVLRALLRTLNLDPATGRWFNVGDISALPRYSAFTNKRRVLMDAIAPGATLRAATPTHLVCIRRSAALRGMRAASLSRDRTIEVLLRQIVIPQDCAVARRTLNTVARCVLRLRGAILLEIGHDAYAQSDWPALVEAALR